MKKRIRKKKHLGEFEKYGILMTLNVNEEQIDEAIDFLDDFADSHKLYSWGGGFGRISTQHVKGSYELPDKVANILMGIMLTGEYEEPTFCIYSPKYQYVSEDVKKELETAFANSPYKVSIESEQVALWH